jgi:putative addiction module killer protein
MENQLHSIPGFDRWLDDLPDRQGRIMILRRLERARQGNFGDYKPVPGSRGLFEMRLDYGPGYRIYYARTGRIVYLLLAGGIKSTQAADIAEAKVLWQRIKEGNHDPKKH